MFRITENNFIQKNIVKYIDDNGNRLMITAPKDGESLRIKLRPSDKDISVPYIELKYPYEYEGANFQCSAASQDKLEYINSKEFRGILEDSIHIMERWIQISRLLKALTSDMSSFTRIFAPAEQRDNLEMDLTEATLNDLSEFEETKNFVTFYISLYDHDITDIKNVLQNK